MLFGAFQMQLLLRCPRHRIFDICHPYPLAMLTLSRLFPGPVTTQRNLNFNAAFMQMRNYILKLKAVPAKNIAFSS